MDIEIVKGKKDITKTYQEKSDEEIFFFTEEELNKLFNSENKFYRMIYRFYYETAARCNEGRAVKFSDFEFDKGKVKIEILKKRERIYRRIVITDKLISQVLQYERDNVLNAKDYIFAKISNEKSITQQAMDKKLKDDCKKLGIDIKKAHMHTFRHTRAIQLLDSGMEIRLVQLFLGHESILTTVKYLRYSNKHIDAAVKVANEMVKI